MKDLAHHRENVQRQVLRSSRKEAILEKENLPRSQTSASPSKTAISNNSNHDRKRKIALDFVYHTSQRERMH